MDKKTVSGRGTRGRGVRSDQQQQFQNQRRGRGTPLANVGRGSVGGGDSTGNVGRGNVGGGDSARNVGSSAGRGTAWTGQRVQQSAWGQQTVATVVQGQPTAVATQQQGIRLPAPASLGETRAATVAARSYPGGDNEGSCAGNNARGALRGKRPIGDVMFRTRPTDCVSKMGSTGQRVTAQANYFRVLKTPEWTIHQYRVDFSPDIDFLRARRYYLSQHKEKFGGYLFDGTVLYTTVYFEKPFELLTKNREGETVQVKIKHVGLVDASDSNMLQVLNLILRRSMEGLKLQLVGRNFFDPKAKIGIHQFKLEIWPGYTTSIRQHEQDVLLCAEIAHKVMRTDTLYQILANYARESADYQNSFRHEVIGMIVITDYNNKTYKISDVDFNLSPLSTFETKSGPMTFVDYYKKRYNITIRDKNQPLLQSKPTERNLRAGENELICLVPELARATGITDEMRNNFQLMKAMGDHTRLNPQKRIERLKNFNGRLLSSPESIEQLNSWNLMVDQDLVELPARILPKQTIVFGNNATFESENADWSSLFRKNSMYSSANLKRWTVVVNRRSVQEVQNFIQLCMRVARGMRFEMVQPQVHEMPDDRTVSYAQAIETCVAKDPQMLMLVLSNKNTEKYSCIKKKCCIDRPVPSQVVTLRLIAPRPDKASGLMSVATKVVIQMNAKLMGAPWKMNIPLSGLMTVGFDVCHSPKEQKSYGALVATMDQNLSTRYFSAVSEHIRGQELSNEISMNMVYALNAFCKEHGKLPARILFYRDAVGDGQLHQVVNTELNAIRNKIDQVYEKAGNKGGYRMAFIIVSKRINTRYFINGNNPPPGTVVDDVITMPERYDFYLVSQSVRQGTVSPTSYNVIFDNMGLDADKLQILTYKLTHLYYNFSGTCRVPAVVQYAHKLAFLVGENLQRIPSSALEKQLYFL